MFEQGGHSVEVSCVQPPGIRMDERRDLSRFRHDRVDCSATDVDTSGTSTPERRASLVVGQHPCAP